jgi:hypothetical protein
MRDPSFIKFLRSPESLELLKRPKAFALFALIAYRAKRSDERSVLGLGLGEALVGDLGSIGLSEQEYRTAKQVLERMNLATFRGTTRGTVACLIDSRVFDINTPLANGLPHERTTIAQRSGNEQTTTNNKERRKRKKRTEKKSSAIPAYEKFRLTFLRKAAMPQVSSDEIRDAR